MKLLIAALYFFLFTSCSGCIWGTVAIVGVAVAGANVNEIQEAYSNKTATMNLDEHLADKKDEDEVFSGRKELPDEFLDTDIIIETYGDPIQDN